MGRRFESCRAHTCFYWTYAADKWGIRHKSQWVQGVLCQLVPAAILIGPGTSVPGVISFSRSRIFRINCKTSDICRACRFPFWVSPDSETDTYTSILSMSDFLPVCSSTFLHLHRICFVYETLCRMRLLNNIENGNMRNVRVLIILRRYAEIYHSYTVEFRNSTDAHLVFDMNMM